MITSFREQKRQDALGIYSCELPVQPEVRRLHLLFQHQRSRWVEFLVKPEF